MAMQTATRVGGDQQGGAALYRVLPWGLAGYTKATDYSYAHLAQLSGSTQGAKKALAAAGYPTASTWNEWAEFQGWNYASSRSSRALL